MRFLVLFIFCLASHCHAALTMMGEADFASLIENTHSKAVVLVSKKKCSPCRLMKEVLEVFSERYPKILFAEIKAESSRALVKRLLVRGYPTLFFYNKGQIVLKLEGYVAEEVFERAFREVFGG